MDFCPSDSPAAEANVPDSALENLVYSGSSGDIIPSGIDYGPLPNGSEINDIDLSKSELLSCGLRWRFLSQQNAIEGEGEQNTLLSAKCLNQKKKVREALDGLVQEEWMKVVVGWMTSMRESGVWTVVDLPRRR